MWYNSLLDWDKFWQLRSTYFSCAFCACSLSLLVLGLHGVVGSIVCSGLPTHIVTHAIHEYQSQYSYFSGARDCLQHNHNHEFSDTLLNQLFQERQPSNIQRNTIPPLAIFFAINWSVGYWWRWSGYWKKSTFQLFPSIIKKVLISADLSPVTSSPSNF